MHCQSCGKEIDDKAIICYRCGEPSAVPAPARRPLPAGRPRWGLVPIVGLIAGLGTWLVPMTPPDSPARWAAFAGVALVTFVSIRLYTGGRGHRIN